MHDILRLADPEYTSFFKNTGRQIVCNSCARLCQLNERRHVDGVNTIVPAPCTLSHETGDWVLE